ncbi:hypothetical protein J2Z49_002748 [Desulfofundulus luciae]|uniref:Big-1 domain-containing protein n=1 Tax=Desulfofundulus luciae TaxID=74702 RepID=A0ABU0B876_9FIRM|nr:hypothetical protein [Desulfofundulus luciae]MDQ0287618.1 hypothetical protein [Desulfofundulus luciae]
MQSFMHVFHAHKRRMFLALFAVALLLIAAVPAWAAPALTVTPNQVPADNEDHTYTLSVTGLALSPNNLNGQNITVTYPSGFDVVGDATNPVKVTVTAVVDSKPYVFICDAAGDSTAFEKGTINIPAGSLPAAGTVSAITVQGFTVKSPKTAGSGNVEVKFADSATTTVTASLTWSQVVKTVAITGPTAAVKAGSSFQVIGTVQDAASAGLENKTVTVTITDLAGQAVATQTATTVSGGNFTSPAFNLTKAGNYVIKATCEGVTGSQNLTVDPAAASNVVFIEKPGALTKGVESGSFTVGLQDQYGNSVTPTSDVDVFLTGPDVNGNPAGVFKSGGSVVTKVTLTSASDTQSFTFTPSVTGSVTITALSGSLTPATAQYNVAAPQAPSSVQLQLAPKSTTTDGKPIAGTSITATLTTDVPADKAYSINVKLTSSDGTTIWSGSPSASLSQGQKQATFTITTTTDAADRVLTVEVSFTPTGASSAIKALANIGPFAAASGNVPTSVTLTLTPAAKDSSGNALAGSPITATLTTDVAADKDYPVNITLSSGGATPAWASAPSTVTIAKGQKQATFIITTTSSAAGNTLSVSVTGIGSGDSDSVTFASSTANFTRSLVPGWQVISVPLKLNKSLADLLGGADKFEALYLYDAATQSWKLYSQMTSEEQYGKPLVGYVVKMKEAVLAQADYQKVTATQAVPPTLALKQGWNLVGASPSETANKVADMLASVSGKFSTVVNPGLGNQAQWTAGTASSDLTATTYIVNNGDAYWVFMTADGTLAGLMAPPVQ